MPDAVTTGDFMCLRPGVEHGEQAVLYGRWEGPPHTYGLQDDLGRPNCKTEIIFVERRARFLMVQGGRKCPNSAPTIYVNRLAALTRSQPPTTPSYSPAAGVR